MTLRDILATLRGSYCRSVGIEYMHIQDNEQRTWLQERFERPFVPWPREEHLRILDKLNEAEIFETFLQTKFVGQKRFSLAAPTKIRAPAEATQPVPIVLTLGPTNFSMS